MDNKDFVIDRSGCLKEYNGDSDTVIIPEGVISIGSDVFQNCENEHIKKIVFPASLKKNSERYIFPDICRKSVQTHFQAALL